jgi:hypothetical protein
MDQDKAAAALILKKATTGHTRTQVTMPTTPIAYTLEGVEPDRRSRNVQDILEAARNLETGTKPNSYVPKNSEATQTSSNTETKKQQKIAEAEAKAARRKAALERKAALDRKKREDMKREEEQQAENDAAEPAPEEEKKPAGKRKLDDKEADSGEVQDASPAPKKLKGPEPSIAGEASGAAVSSTMKVKKATKAKAKPQKKAQPIERASVATHIGNGGAMPVSKAKGAPQTPKKLDRDVQPSYSSQKTTSLPRAKAKTPKTADVKSGAERGATSEGATKPPPESEPTEEAIEEDCDLEAIMAAEIAEKGEQWFTDGESNIPQGVSQSEATDDVAKVDTTSTSFPVRDDQSMYPATDGTKKPFDTILAMETPEELPQVPLEAPEHLAMLKDADMDSFTISTILDVFGSAIPSVNPDGRQCAFETIKEEAARLLNPKSLVAYSHELNCTNDEKRLKAKLLSLETRILRLGAKMCQLEKEAGSSTGSESSSSSANSLSALSKELVTMTAQYWIERDAYCGIRKDTAS